MTLRTVVSSCILQNVLKLLLLLPLILYYGTSNYNSNLIISVTAFHLQHQQQQQLQQQSSHPSTYSKTIVHHTNMFRFQFDTAFPIIPSRIQTQCLFLKKMMITTTTRVSRLYMINTYVSMIDQFVQTSPYTTAAIACGIKASSADWIAQKRQLRKRNEPIVPNSKDEGTGIIPTSLTSITPSKKVKTDVLRNIAFLLYGALYQGMGQEYIYNHLYPLYFGTGTNMVTVLIKVAFDLLIQTTLLTLPVAYGIKAIIYKYTFQEAIRRYVDDIMNHGLLMKYYTLWGPVQCITFSIIPERYRISFIAIVSFFWLIILSSISSRVRSTTTGSNVTTITTSEKTNVTDTVTTSTSSPSSLSTQECELVDGLTCNIDG